MGSAPHAPPSAQRSRWAELAVWASVVAVVALLLVPRLLHRRRDVWALEAVRGVNRVARAAAAWSRTHGPLPPARWVPARPCCQEAGNVCRVAPTAAPGGLRLPVGPPFRYQYRVGIEKGRLVARARGDLDCDGQAGAFEVAGTRRSGAWLWGPVRAWNPRQ